MLMSTGIKSIAEDSGEVKPSEAEENLSISTIVQIPDAAGIETPTSSNGKLLSVVNQSERGSRRSSKLESLRERYKPYKVQKIAQLCQNLSDRFNWDAFLEHYDNIYYFDFERGSDPWDNHIIDNGLATFASLRRIQQMAEDGTLAGESYGQLKFWEHTIIANAQEWEKRNFLLPEPVVQEGPKPSVEAIKQRRVELRQKVAQELERIKGYSDLKSKFRDMWSYKAPDVFLSAIIYSLEVETDEYDPRFLDAIERFLAKRKQQHRERGLLPMPNEEYAANLEKLHKIGVEEALENIEIKGLEEVEGQILVITKDELKDELRQAIPGCFLDKIEIIIATKRSDKDEDDPNIEVIGSHRPTLDEDGNLISGRIEIYESPRVDKNANIFDKQLARVLFVGATLHEVAHRVHYELDFSDMREWETVVQKDDVEVTWYVGYTREKNPMRTLREDFCETYRLAILHPGYLYDLSPIRYEFMMRFIRKHMGPEQKNAFLTSISESFYQYKGQKSATAQFITGLNGEQ